MLEEQVRRAPSEPAPCGCLLSTSARQALAPDPRCRSTSIASVPTCSQRQRLQLAGEARVQRRSPIAHDRPRAPQRRSVRPSPSILFHSRPSRRRPGSSRSASGIDRDGTRLDLLAVDRPERHEPIANRGAGHVFCQPAVDQGLNVEPGQLADAHGPGVGMTCFMPDP